METETVIAGKNIVKDLTNGYMKSALCAYSGFASW
jgi:hypothetical protein